MEIKLTIDATPQLLQALNSLAGILGAPAAPSEPTAAKPKKPTKVEDAPPAAPEKTAENKDNTERITLEQIRATATSSDELRKKAKSLLDKFGAQNLGSLPAEKYADFYRDLKAA